MKLMLEKKISGLPVVEDDGTLVGILSATDVVSLVYNIAYKSESLEKKKVFHYITERAISFDKDKTTICSTFATFYRRISFGECP